MEAPTKALAAVLFFFSLSCSPPPPPPRTSGPLGRREGGAQRLRAEQPRYGAVRDGTAVLVFVTEDFSDSLRVKADPGKHPASDVYPVLKLNAVRHFPTGIYDYNVMTSAFLRVAPGWPVAKVSFSSQEWCGHVWHQVVPRDGRLGGVFHSYFDGEADGTDDLDFPKDGVLEDALPVLLRGWNGEYLKPGRAAPCRSFRACSGPASTTGPSRGRRRRSRGRRGPRFRVRARRPLRGDRVHRRDRRRALARLRRRGRAALPARPPDRPRRRGARARGSTRLPYWQLNGPGGERT
jgi:hypothetical protein